MSQQNPFQNLALGIRNRDGAQVANFLRHSKTIPVFYRKAPLSVLIHDAEKAIPEKWQKIAIASAKTQLSDEYNYNDADIFQLVNEVVKSLVEIVYNSNGWILKPLFVACDQLKTSAIKSAQESDLEICSRTLGSAIKATASDDPGAPPTAKPVPPKNNGYYVIVNMLLNIYFRVRKFSLAMAIFTSTSARAVVPLEGLPSNQQVPFLYYWGVLTLIEQKWDFALAKLESALRLCPQNAVRNQELILFYLIPLKIKVQGKFPAKSFPWHSYPALAKLYRPIIATIKSGDLGKYRSLIDGNYSFLVSKHLYLLLLKLTGNVRVHLAHKVWVIRERTNQLDLEDFVTAFALAGQFDAELSPDLYMESTQLLLANMIQSGDLLGVIYGQSKKMVVKKGSPFPHIKSRNQT